MKIVVKNADLFYLVFDCPLGSLGGGAPQRSIKNSKCLDFPIMVISKFVKSFEIEKLRLSAFKFAPNH